MSADLFAMQNTNYFTAEEATMVVSVVVAFFVILGLLFAKGPVIRERAIPCLVRSPLPL